MKPSHLQAYAEAYLKGLFFILLQFALAWGVCAARLTPEARAHMFRFDWLTFIFAVLAMSLPACIAFLDGSVERGRQAMANATPADPPAYTPPKPGQIAVDPLVTRALEKLAAEDPLAHRPQTNTGG